MQFKVTLIERGTTQRVERIVNAPDERAAGWAVLQGGNQLIAVQAIGSSTQYAASAAPQPAAPHAPRQPPNPETVRWTFLVTMLLGSALLIFGLGTFFQALSHYRAAHAEYLPTEQRYEYMKRTDPMYAPAMARMQTDPAYARMSAAWDRLLYRSIALIAGIALLVSGCAIRAWSRAVTRGWEASRVSGARSADIPT